MKKIIAGTLLLAVATLTIHAQQIPGKAGAPDRERRKDSFHGIQLSEDQRAKFKSMNDAFRKQMETLRKQDDITVKEWRSRMDNLRKEHREKVQGLLTTEQKAQLDKRKQDRAAMRKIDHDARAQKTKIRLGLSDEQASRMAKNREDLEKRGQAIRDNTSLTDDQRREQMRQLRDQRRESLKSILTEEQLKRLHEQHERGAHHHPREVI